MLFLHKFLNNENPTYCFLLEISKLVWIKLRIKQQGIQVYIKIKYIQFYPTLSYLKTSLQFQTLLFYTVDICNLIHKKLGPVIKKLISICCSVINRYVMHRYLRGRAMRLQKAKAGLLRPSPDKNTIKNKKLNLQNNLAGIRKIPKSTKGRKYFQYERFSQSIN